MPESLDISMRERDSSIGRLCFFRNFSRLVAIVVSRRLVLTDEETHLVFQKTQTCCIEEFTETAVDLEGQLTDRLIRVPEDLLGEVQVSATDEGFVSL
jgi:hypothetical protein